MNPTFYQLLTPEAPYRIALCPDSPIYRAHFPGRPITPGACLVQLVEELAQLHFSDSTLRVSQIVDAKFLALLEPQHHPQVEVRLSGTPARLSATIACGAQVFARLTVELSKNGFSPLLLLSANSP